MRAGMQSVPARRVSRSPSPAALGPLEELRLFLPQGLCIVVPHLEYSPNYVTVHFFAFLTALLNVTLSPG